MRPTRIHPFTVRCAFAVLCLSASGALAVEIPRQEYLHYLPPGHPRLVQQTKASVERQLYGDAKQPDYRDADHDGIDDRRHEVLMALAVRFAPHLVQNTNNLPVDFRHYIANRDSFSLYIDTWQVSDAESRLMQTEAVNLSVLGKVSCATPDSMRTDMPKNATLDPALEDCKFQEVLQRFSPLTTDTHRKSETFVRDRPTTNEVLWLDFPGEGPENWDIAYEDEYDRTPDAQRASFVHSWVHPFLVKALDAGGAPVGYELVLQYWFYYPSNDGGNNHEGDWEHLNVVIAPLSGVLKPLSAETVDRILEGELPATDDAADPLVIRRIEYYFHHFVMALDFTEPNVYQSRRKWKKDIDGRRRDHLREDEIWHAIRELAYVDDEETIYNTHPLGYIGADNKGFDQALTNPGGKNRNSHGTFPFPGRYHNIGPAGATEQISLYVDPRRKARRLRSAAGLGPLPPAFERGAIVNLAYPQRLTIVPDWERLVEPVRRDAGARRAWGWMLLPIRWGYPATESPLAGILPHADTGNLAPHGPSFSSGWNVSGPAAGFGAYEPHTLPAIFPLRMQDGFRNDLGWFNLTYPVLFNLPPLDFLSRLGTYPFKLIFSRRDPVYYPRESLPYRFVGLSSGVSIQNLSEDWNAMTLNPQHYDQFVGSIVNHLVVSGFDSTTTILSATDFQDTAVGSFIQVPFYIGTHFSSESMVRNTRSAFGLDVAFNNIAPYAYEAELNYWEYAGSLRYSVTDARLQPFVKLGYGWSWYRIENAQANGQVFTPEKTDWIKPRNILPNVWHFGVGLEYVPWKRYGTFPGGTELSLRFEYARYMEGLGLDLSGVSLDRLSLAFTTLGDVPLGERVARDDFLFGLTLSF